ncbi:MAG: hypothetical protein JSU07_04095 [Bacteroidetes bacterium]|nr:hypothetical protein [Bacteroidota bacterium]
MKTFIYIFVSIIIVAETTAQNTAKIYSTISNKEFNTSIITNTYTNAELLLKADALNNDANTMLINCVFFSNEDKKQIKLKALSLKKEADVIVLQVNENIVAENIATYMQNTNQIAKFYDQIIDNSTIPLSVTSLINDAIASFKLSYEIQQESQSIKSIAARAASLSNAIEKQIIALNKQSLAISIAKQIISNTGHSKNAIAFK